MMTQYNQRVRFLRLEFLSMAVRADSIRRAAVRLGAYLLIILGVSVLAGWIFNITPLLTVLPGRITMKSNTAVSFLCAGLALALITRQTGGRR